MTPSGGWGPRDDDHRRDMAEGFQRRLRPRPGSHPRLLDGAMERDRPARRARGLSPGSRWPHPRRRPPSRARLKRHGPRRPAHGSPLHLRERFDPGHGNRGAACGAFAKLDSCSSNELQIVLKSRAAGHVGNSHNRFFQKALPRSESRTALVAGQKQTITSTRTKHYLRAARDSNR